ncbi:Glycosyltransferase involved in cell wall bisynthesis [Pseudomonas sp. NFPP10]|uniref:glycosyltransferase family 4 protein n=1 Tax=unclassified Pseudomonas TaxID=196821 RepID=UPI0008840D6B|nr:MULTISPECIES: glycosyltransferase family 4 protein [unclassified Pseudomonas]SDA16804.1 Glycosyltransferase involved in cell wall bisynthesis [Pseudomonas sp. NFPP12]SEK83763.1 Glycosyltransferase involved in cell wall bisynthesis [Pseudomonas sp. NFPP10]SFI43778.1 Glycosyltransferase involved in cell wall bisynthesis [Pseudomonas sp. NFPP08]SFM34385.1 Glycosyltransferase involved in cell wall bisynthesis [Pseudomonas sp. NFPP05]SFX22953.1 Glycosyltransferase involved in cell wall bisynthes
MKILWTLPYLPWPATSGGKTRQYHLLRALAARGHRITLLVQSKTPLDDATRAALEPWLERLIVLPRRPLRSLKTLFSVLFAPYPMLADVNGLAVPLQQRFRELLEEPWDVIQIEHSYSFQPFEQPLKQLQRPFILTEHNVESALGAASYDRLPAWSKPFTRYDQWRYRRWERRVFQQAARVIAVTEQDALTLARLSGKPAAVVVNGVDCGHYAAVQPDLGSQRLLFIGNYEYSPNLDAVQWALEEILPRLWAINPEVHFAICGYALPNSFRQRWTDPRIEWQGFVPDLRDLQRRSALFFAPLRQGGGSKLKVLEAMAAGLPVVTTAQGSSGLQVENGQHYLGSEDPGALAQILAQALADPERLQRIGAAGRDYVLAHHDWSAAAAQLEAVYHQLPSDKEEVSVCA